MDKLKRVIHKLLFPNVAVLIILIPLSLSLMIYSFIDISFPRIVAYISYALAFYSLVILSVRAPRIIRFFKEFKDSNAFLQRYFGDNVFRTKLSLYASLSFCTAYAIMQLFLGIFYGSVWEYSLAFYYFILALIRLILLLYTRKHSAKDNMLSEIKRYRLTGFSLLLVNTALLGILLYVTIKGRSFDYHPIIAIAMAAYTFTSLTLTIINLVKQRRYGSPVFSAISAVGLSSALVSMLILECALLSVFGDGSLDNGLMILLTGIGIILFILGIALYMVIRSNRQIKNYFFSST